MSTTKRGAKAGGSRPAASGRVTPKAGAAAGAGGRASEGGGAPKGGAAPKRGGTPKGGGVPAARRAMPAGAEAVRAQRLAARQGGARPEETAGPPPGVGVLRSATVGTAAFVASTAVAAAVPSARIGAVVIDLLFLVAGSGFYFWGWAVAAGRSRESEITMWNLILLEDVAPPKVRARLLGALAIQVVVAAATCWITAALAFGWLVPVWGLAHCEYWGARYGTFQPRKAAETRNERRGRRR